MAAYAEPSLKASATTVVGEGRDIVDSSLQAAADALNAQGGGVLSPKGVFALGKPLTMYSRVDIDRADATIIPHAAFAGGSSMLVYVNREHCGIDGLHIDAENHAAVLHAIYAAGCLDLELTGSEIENVKTTAASAAVRFLGGERLAVLRNALHDGYRGVWASNNGAEYCRRLRVEANDFERFTEMGLYVIGDVNGASEHVSVLDNDFRSIIGGVAREPLYFSSGAGGARHRVGKVRGNTLIGNGTAFVAGTGNGDMLALYDVEDFRCTENYVSGGGDIGISVFRSRRVIVAMNESRDHNTIGICLWDTLDSEVVGNIVLNNFRNYDGALAGPYGGIELRADTAGATAGTYVGGNRSFDTQAPKTQSFGLRIAANVSDTRLGLNNFNGNLTAPISSLSASTFYEATTAPFNLASSDLRVGGQQQVTGRKAAIADAAGGLTIDAEARAALNALLARVRSGTGHGLIT